MEVNTTRKNIVNTASNLFYEKGYNKTDIDEIITGAGITKETLEEHFKSKEEICIAHLRFRNEKFSKEVLAYVDQVDHGKSKILAIFNYLELFYQMQNFDGCWAIKVFSEVSVDEIRIREEVAFLKRDMISFIDFLIHDNMDINLLKDSNMLAQKIYLLLETAVMQSNILREEWPITSAKKMCDELLS